jgi:hypothetical protein
VERIAQTPERAFPTGRLSRAALMALAAASVGAIDGCSSNTSTVTHYGSPIPVETGGSGGVMTNGSGGRDGAGAAPTSGGRTGTGGTVATGGGPGAGGGLVAAYGAPMFTGGRSNGGAGESNDSGTASDADTDAASGGGTGGHSAAPLYGLPPIKP